MDLLAGLVKPLIGMVHVQALPGTPGHRYGIEEIRDRAVTEARQLVEAGFDAVMVENMHDVPYLNRCVGPEIVASMSVVARAVREAVSCPLGVQILAGANREAVAVAQAAGAQFVRVEGFVFGHVADEGLMQSDAAELLRYRCAIGAEGVRVWADIKKKHSSHAITADVSLGETAEAAQFFGADALVVTGTATGKPVSPEDLVEVARASTLPRVAGSGVTPENFRAIAPLADAFIVGSYLKEDGRWSEALDAGRMEKMVAAARGFRATHGVAPPAQHTEIY